MFRVSGQEKKLEKEEMTIGEASRKLSVFTKEHFPAVLLLPHRRLKATEAV